MEIKKIKTSLISTVFEEEEEIIRFLMSVASQSKKLDEVVIVDGGSKDDTYQRILEFKNKYPKLNLKILKKKTNIAQGRNLAIKNALGDIILCSDVGCTLDKNWIKNILEPFKDKKIDVVAGFYEPDTKNVFEKSLSTYTCVMSDKVDEERFLPSSRSIAFKKSAWKEVGRYPEWLDTCEDLYFARELKKNGFKFRFVKKAIVYWPQRKNLRQATMQFFDYAKGDGMAHYVRRNTPFLFMRYLVGFGIFILWVLSGLAFLFIIIFVLLIAYIAWAIIKNYKYVNNYMAIIYLPILQFAADFAVITGMLVGLLGSLSVKKPQL